MKQDVEEILKKMGYDDADMYYTTGDGAGHMEREDARQVFADAYRNVLSDIRRDVDPEHAEDPDDDFEPYYDGWSQRVSEATTITLHGSFTTGEEWEETADQDEMDFVLSKIHSNDAISGIDRITVGKDGIPQWLYDYDNANGTSYTDMVE